MNNPLLPVVEGRIDEFCWQLALALRRIMGCTRELSTSNLPKVVTTDRDEDQKIPQSDDA